MLFKPKKSLGQNFLVDENILNKIIDVARISNNDSILEVGPGTGKLTELIINNKPKDIVVVEKDTRLSKFLKNKFKNQIKVLNNDILKIPDKLYNKPYTIFGNLPYNISTQILSKWCLNNKFKFKKLILMFQKEVGDRIIAKENTKNYSRITILSKWKFDITKICDVSPNSFFPKPKIKSTLLEFTPKLSYIELKNPKNLENITKLFFNQRRKMVKKNFKVLFKNIETILKDLNIKPTDRPQNISVDKYLMIVKEFEKNLK